MDNTYFTEEEKINVLFRTFEGLTKFPILFGHRYTMLP